MLKKLYCKQNLYSTMQLQNTQTTVHLDTDQVNNIFNR